MLKRKHKKHLDKKLIFRLRIFLVISVLLIGVVIYEILTNRVSLPLALLGAVIGFGIGIISSRMYSISWDKDAKKVIARLDILGGVILGIYILISIFRTRIIGHFIPPTYVTGMSLSVVGGLMIGRVFGTTRQITTILKKQNLLDD